MFLVARTHLANNSIKNQNNMISISFPNSLHVLNSSAAPQSLLQHLAPGHGVKTGCKPEYCKCWVYPVPVTSVLCIVSHKHYQRLLGIKIVLQQHSNLGPYFLNLSSFFQVQQVIRAEQQQQRQEDKLTSILTTQDLINI